ncbi:GNAT family N-acetyltransferase [Blastomonas fulva]|uniref:GNAT family N-acetyltransferase n=1 Tax=Blastomonas fulva TaxID=1550728 RepID=UPI003F7156F5
MLEINHKTMLANAAPLGAIDCAVVPGVASAVDRLAAQAPASHAFLRAAWFCRGEPEAISTLVARRGDGSEILALPMRQLGPAGLKARALAGSYWPFRSAAIDQTAGVGDMRAVLDHPAARAAIGPMLRLGPIYQDDRLAQLVVAAAEATGWHVLTRDTGQSFIQDLPGPGAPDPWPSKSRRKKIRRMIARLEELGPLTLRIVRGDAWSRRVFHDLAQIEENSWVGKRTDRSGAKFLNPHMLAHWQRAVVDPELAEMLAATLLYVGDKPVAFSLDLTCGSLQYGIASSYDDAFAAFSPGQIVTLHGIDDSLARGVRQIDWGAGDSGYKQELGARPGSRIHDLLLVRSATIAAALRPRWEESAGSGTLAIATGLADAIKASGLPSSATIKRLLMSGLTLSAAAALMVE